MTSLPATPAATQQKTIRGIVYNGPSGQLFGIYMVNLLLTLVTLGIYHFWARTRVRRFCHQHTQFLDEPFTYLGTGRELFFGAMKFVFIIILPSVLLLTALGFILRETPYIAALGILYAVLFYCIRLYARLAGMRYRANRMSWRGIRFLVRVRRGEYISLMLKVLLLNIVTLGLYRPYGDHRLVSLFLSKASYGNLSFTGQGDRDYLTSGYFLYWLLIPFTFGMSLIWYRARLQRYIARAARLGPMEFRYEIRGGSLFWLLLSNALIVLASFGLLNFYATQRKMHFFADNFRARNLPDFTNVKKAEIDASNEGAADYLGADLDIGL